MEQQNVNTILPPMDTTMKRRPTFLTVLCILSFVGIGLVVISSLYNVIIYSGDTVKNSLEQASQILQQSNNPFGNFIQNPDEYISAMFTMNLVNLISAMVCLVGVIMMWKLKKLGFFIYTVAELASPIIAMILSGRIGMGSAFFASFMVVIMVISLIFALAFVIMYAVNLKHLTK